MFARCVILEIYKNKQSCKVFFIDEAVTAAVSKKVYPFFYQLIFFFKNCSVSLKLKKASNAFHGK